MQPSHIKYIFFILFVWTQVNAQHFQFSQFYAAPTYLNPAFTGANVCSRFCLNYRNQWAGIPGTFTSYQGSVDHSLRKYKSGIGLSFFNDKAGLGSLTTTQVSLLYAYEAKLNKQLMGRGGISVGTVQRKVDYSQLLFGDQVARDGASTSLEGFTDARTSYFDIGAGGLVYSRYAWLGLAASHLNRPDQSLLNGTAPLPTEIRLHAGYKYIIEEAEVQDKKMPHNNAVTFAFNYKKQSKFNQIDAGLYYNRSVLVLGIWYRGIPLFRPAASYTNNDAVILILGFNMDKYRIGYSYDYTVSRLRNTVTRGTHELSCAYQFCNLKKSKKKKNQLISCPKF